MLQKSSFHSVRSLIFQNSSVISWRFFTTIGYDDSGVNDITKQISKVVAGAKGFVLFGDTAMPSYEKDPYVAALMKVFEGNMDGKAFTEELAKAIR